MRSVILQIDVTLDGFIADSRSKLDFVTGDPEMNQDASDVLAAADTILLGRVSYTEFIQFWPHVDTGDMSQIGRIAYRLNTMDKLIFSQTLDSVEWGNWQNARLVRDDIASEIARLKAEPGKNLLLYGGAEMIASFVKQRLIDEYRIRVHPVVLGGGKPLFPALPDARQLRLVNAKPYANGAVLLDYVPADK